MKKFWFVTMYNKVSRSIMATLIISSPGLEQPTLSTADKFFSVPEELEVLSWQEIDDKHIKRLEEILK